MAQKNTRCIACNQPLSLSAWDHFNGFLVPCPSCKRWHGKMWYTKTVMLAALFLNALSFFFVMRPRRALLSLIPFLALVGIAATGVVDRGPEWLMLTWVVFFLFGPMAVNAVLLIRHRARLGEAVTEDLPRSPTASAPTAIAPK